MKATLQTILALLIAGVIHLQAQPERSPAQVAWDTLLASQLEETSKDDALTNPGAIAIRDMIVASEVVNAWDIEWLEKFTRLITDGDQAVRIAAGRAAVGEIAASAKTGRGMAAAKAMVKFWNRDMSDWSDEMIDVRPGEATFLAQRADATPEFKNRVWLEAKKGPMHSAPAFFKDYRSKLSKEEQIALTQNQKNIMISLPSRSARASAWLAEIAADLIALQLDQ